MTELLTAAQMQAFERGVIESGVVSGLELMERAGRGVVDAVFARNPALAAVPGRALVFCGPGNNGGDGYVIARILRDWGWEVELRALGDPDRLPPDALANARRWRERGAILPFPGADDDPARSLTGGAADLFVDAVFGTGLTRSLSPDIVAALAAVDALDAQPGSVLCRVAVDMPTGLCSDSGRNMGNPCRYDLTVTFHGAKPGHFLADGPALCGALAQVDIGLPKREPGSDAPVEVAHLVGAPRGVLKRAGHKYDHGHAVVLSGPMGRSGAGRMAARAALRIGAGLVTVAAPGSAMMECAAQLTAIMLRRCDGAAELSDLLADARLNAVCMGPGLGVGQGTADLVEAALAASGDTGRAGVLDADALTAFQDAPGRLFEMASAAGRVVMTPHFGEFHRLFPDLAERLLAVPESGPAYSRLDAVRTAAARAGSVVLLKGADTVIAAPDGRAAVHAAAYARSAPWLATAGAGDVLAGLVTGLLARGQAPFEAAKAAAWLHVEAARKFGPGLVAEDLPDALPAVLRSEALRADTPVAG